MAVESREEKDARGLATWFKRAGESFDKQYALIRESSDPVERTKRVDSLYGSLSAIISFCNGTSSFIGTSKEDVLK